MSLITQYSRIKHHTITTGTFSVPPTEDFTQGVWTKDDLCRSEIGIHEGDKEVYVRIDDEVLRIVTEDTLPSTFPVLLGTVSANTLTGVWEDIYVYDLPPDTVFDQEGLHLRVGLRTDSNSDPKEVRLTFNGQVVYQESGTMNDFRIVADYDLMRNGADASVAGMAMVNTTCNAGVGLLPGLSWSGTQSIAISASCSNVGDVELYTLKIMDMQ